MNQIDLFGNEIAVKDLPKPKRGRERFRTMQQRHGEFKGFTCGQCEHCVCKHHNGKNFYKCELWLVSNSAATDIRLRNTACMKFEVEED